MNIFAPVISAFTRLCCALLGFGIPVVSIPLALLASAFPQGEPFTPPWQLAASVIGCACLLASGFAMFAVGWRARFERRAYRGVTFLLLLIPLVVGMELMASPVQFPPTHLAIAFSAFTGWLLLLCAWPGLLAAPTPAQQRASSQARRAGW